MTCTREPPWHEPPLKEDKILMIDYAPTQARSKGVISTPSCGWGQVEVVVAKAPSASPLSTADRVDKLYRQLAEIHATTAVQLVECACWRH
jgi:hypothetical protein